MQAVRLVDPAGVVSPLAEDQRGAAAALPARPIGRRFRARAGAVPRLERGLSASTITRLCEQWQDEQRAFARRNLSGVDYVYVWADGIHVNIRLEEHKLCLLVLVGVRADGSKELITLTDGYRESVESWADLLRDAKRRGMRAPVLAVGDGALGFWGGLREVFPETREQRCWFHKGGNVLAAMPKSAHPTAKKALAEIWGAEDKTHAQAAVTAFVDLFGAKFPKAVAKITDDLEQLLAFYDYPAEHWVHLRTTNPTPHQDHPRPPLQSRRPGNGLQADHRRPGPVAGSQRAAPRRPRPCRRDVRQRQTRRTNRRSTSRHATRRDRRMTRPAAGTVHHIELWVPDLPRATAEWSWLLEALGYLPFQSWSSGRSWRLGDTYLVIEQSPAMTAGEHDRKLPGLNHLAFYAGEKASVDALAHDGQRKRLDADVCRHPSPGRWCRSLRRLPHQHRRLRGRTRRCHHVINSRDPQVLTMWVIHFTARHARYLRKRAGLWAARHGRSAGAERWWQAGHVRL